MNRHKTVAELPEIYIKRYPYLDRDLLRKLIRLEKPVFFATQNDITNNSNLRKLDHHMKKAFRQKTQEDRIKQLKEIIRAWGENPEEILNKDALMRGNRTVIQQEDEEIIDILRRKLKELDPSSTV